MGIADVVNSRAAALAARFNIPKVFPTMEAMMNEGVDVIHILTPPDTHAQLAIAALESGCHVLVEKPLAINAEEVDRISAAAAAAQKSVCVNHSMLYDRFVSKALGLVRSGAIGVPLSFDYFRSSEYPPYRGGPLPIHYQDGGYPFLDQGVHALYLAESFLGAIEDVKAFYGTHGGDSNLLFDEWRVAAQCERGTANIQISWNVRPLQNWFVVQGTKGVLRANLFAMWVTHTRQLPLPKAPARALQAMLEGLSICTQVPANVARFAAKKIVQYDGLHSLVAAFYSALQTGSTDAGAGRAGALHRLLDEPCVPGSRCRENQIPVPIPECRKRQGSGDRGKWPNRASSGATAVARGQPCSHLRSAAAGGGVHERWQRRSFSRGSGRSRRRRPRRCGNGDCIPRGCGHEGKHSRP